MGRKSGDALDDGATVELFTSECELAVRLYHWATQEYARQREHNYPVLRVLRNRRVDAFLGLVEPLTVEQESLLATALLKRAHPKALRHLGQMATEQERALADRFFVLYVHAIEQATPKAETVALMERRKLVSGAVRVLKPLLGRPTERDVYDIHFDTRVGDWGLSTIVGSGRASVNCEWMLVRSDHDMTRFSVGGPDPMGHDASFDYTSLLGVGRQTAWESVAEDVLEAALAGLEAVCSHLAHELPPLMDGLSREDA